jgi:glutamyl-Q tRNA(Asp) synthetase
LISTTSSPTYTGRFAPSPTGPLHLGSLYTALASYLDARSRQGQWLLRIDDLDHFRIIPKATDQILNVLDKLGLHWDGEVYYQSQHIEDYQAALVQLETQDRLYPCICSRKKLAQSGAVYPGHCRQKTIPADADVAIRIKTPPSPVSLMDRLQGTIQQNLQQQCGDFILKRKDGVIAYQLAVVVDEYQQNISHIVRGLDLLDSTPRQCFLQQCLGLPQPSYMHIPVVVDQSGIKLSKQSHAEAISAKNPAKTLWLLLDLLKQHPLTELKRANVQTILRWGIEHWQPENLKKIRAIEQRIE